MSRAGRFDGNYRHVQALQPGIKLDNEIIIRGSCGEVAINLLLDTGASLSLVATRLVHQLNKMDDIRPTRFKIAGLSKTVIPMRGEIELQVEFAGCRLQHIFIVSDNIDEEILMGIDVMKKTGMQIDIPRYLIVTDQGDAGFINKPVGLSGRYTVKASKTVMIPANSASHLIGRLGIPSTKLNYEGVIIGSNNLTEDCGLCVQGALTYSEGNAVPVQCVNTMPYDVTIYKNTTVGFMEPVEKKERVRAVHRIKGNGDFYDASMDYPRLPTAETEEVTAAKGKWANPEELLEQLNVEAIDISPRQKEQLKSLLIEYNHCFARDKFDLGEASFFEANLLLKNDYVCKWIPSRPTPFNMKHHMDREVNSLINTGQIEKCGYSRWNSCVFLVKKPDGKSQRLVQDLRQLNTQTLPDNFPLPRMDMIMNKMTDNNYLSVFDFLKGFVQIPLEEKSRPLTAFTFDDVRYQWSRLPQGQTNSSSQFARSMAILFSNVPFQALISYLDDILVGSKTVDEHLKRLRFIFQRLSWGNLKISPSKCQLFKQEVKFLGHRISRNGLKIDEDRVKAVQALPEPRNKKQLQQFLGTMNYLRSFINRFSELSAVLYGLLKKNTEYIWDDECAESFRLLKSAMTKAPVLAIPEVQDPHRSYEVTIDSSKKGHGAVLTQMIDGKRRVVSYFSKAVPTHQQKLGASRLEFLGLYHSLKHWRIYLLGTEFRVYSDCMALMRLENLFKNESSYYQRRLAELSGYRFEIHHISGKSGKIQLPDMLSRYPYEYEKTFKEASCQTDSNIGVRSVRLQQQTVANQPLESTEFRIRQAVGRLDDTNQQPVTTQEIRDAYKDDHELSTVIEWMVSGNFPNSVSYRKHSAQICHYWTNHNLLRLEKGILYRRWIEPNDRIKDRDLIVVPSTLVERVIFVAHKNSCHGGVETALELCKRKFYFYKMKREFRLFCEACITCARNKQPQAFLRAPLKPIVYTRFNQCISIDFNEPSKRKTKRGHVALLTIVDMYSNYLVCKPVKSTDSSEAIKLVISEWILKFGAPCNILHDLGTHFTSALFKAMLKIFDIRDTHSTPWHSQTQGRVEAFNKKINVAMRVALSDEQWQEYDKYIDGIVFTLNCLKSSKTGYSSNYLTFGRECAMPNDLFLPDDDRLEDLKRGMTDGEYLRGVPVYDTYREMSTVNRKVVANAATKAKWMKSSYDKKIRGPFPNKGDWCLILIDVTRHKFSDRFKGPYKITEKINNWNYIVEIEGTKKVVNIAKIKPYKPNKYTNWGASNPEPDRDERNSTSGSEARRGNALPTSSDSSSSDSDGQMTIVTRSRRRRLDAREARQARRDVPVQLSLSGTYSPQRTPTYAEVVSPPGDVIIKTELQSEGSDAADDSFVSAGDNPSDDEPSTHDTTVNRPIASGSGTHVGPVSLPAIDRSDILLSDIERHEREARQSREGSGHGGLSRATATYNLATNGSGSSTSRRSGLRNNPKKTSFFGSPVSSLKKKITKR